MNRLPCDFIRPGKPMRSPRSNRVFSFERTVDEGHKIPLSAAEAMPLSSEIVGAERVRPLVPKHHDRPPGHAEYR